MKEKSYQDSNIQRLKAVSERGGAVQVNTKLISWSAGNGYAAMANLLPRKGNIELNYGTSIFNQALLLGAAENERGK